jgi:hypothetical protein
MNATHKMQIAAIAALSLGMIRLCSDGIRGVQKPIVRTHY